MQKSVELYLLAVIAGLVTAGAPTIAQVQAIENAAACFQCIPKAMRDAVDEYLLCTIANK